MRKILLLPMLLILVGCSNPEILPEQIDYSGDISTLNERMTNAESRMTNIEAKQLTAEDIITLTEIQNYQKQEEEINVQGCPSDSDRDKWVDAFSDGDISISQLNKILRKYNDCH